MPIDNQQNKLIAFIQNLLTESQVLMNSIDNLVDVVKGYTAENAMKAADRYVSKIGIDGVEYDTENRVLSIDLSSPKDQYGDYMIVLRTTVTDKDVHAKLRLIKSGLRLEVECALRAMFRDAARRAIHAKDAAADAEKEYSVDDFINLLRTAFEDELGESKCSCSGCVEPCCIDDEEDDETGPEYTCLCGQECGCEKAEPLETEEDCEPGEDPLVDRFCLDENEYFVVEQNPCGKTIVSIYKRREEEDQCL